MLIVFNIGFPLQNVLGESIEDSVDRIIESAMDDDNDERDDDNDERDDDDYLSEDSSGGLFMTLMMNLLGFILISMRITTIYRSEGVMKLIIFILR